MSSGGLRAISSLTNDRVKFIRALDMRKTRRDTGLFVAEGQSILLTAREHGFEPRMLVFQAGSAVTGTGRGLVAGALAAGCECLEVTPAVLEKLASKDNPQTMLGVFQQRWSDPPDTARVAPDACWLALEEVRDPGNLGTILRAADAFGIAGVILIGSCVDPYGREAVRATMGSIFAVPVVRMTREAFVSWRAGWPGDVAGTHLAATEDVRTARPRAPVLVVMGSEGPGLSEAITAACTKLVRIPMAGGLDSLNLSIATAITLFEFRRPYLKV